MADATGSATWGGGLRQITTVALLVGGVMLLHRLAAPPDAAEAFDPTSMLALGFVVLASHAIGQLVERIGLPHITGYLLAGMAFGPSLPTLLPTAWQVPPFDQGILNGRVIEHLNLLDALAVALIALTAGGEIKLDALRRDARTIGGILTGQIVAVAAIGVAFVWIVAGGMPRVALAGLEVPTGAAALSLGGVVAAVALATSPAATIAVINDGRASGPTTRTVLSTVVIKDVIVVVAFSLTSAVAARTLGTAPAGTGLQALLLRQVLGSLVAGAALGMLTALYLRYAGQELLLFLVGAVYTATFVSDRLGLDPVLLFVAAGFTTTSLSRAGDALIDSVERLSAPVYVVFFTLAGARLPLVEMAGVMPFAAALVAARIAALAVGAHVGARFGGADDTTRRYGWMGFVSQAGMAVSLTAVVTDSYGQTGQTLGMLLMASIALNELLGPVLLKAGLGLAGELGSRTVRRSETQAPRAAPQKSPTTTEPRRPEEWTQEQPPAEVWGGIPATSSEALQERIYDLQADLQQLVRELGRGPLDTFRRDAEMYLRELRREFLRHHRRLAVAASNENTDMASLAARLRAEQSELAERWRGIVLGRAARRRRGGWTPESLVESIDRIVEGLPERVQAPWEPESFVTRNEPPTRALRRTALRLRRSFHQLVGTEMPPRSVELRRLARYHLSGRIPARLEGLAALLVESDRHLAARTRGVFDAIVQGYDDLAARLGDSDVEPGDELVRLRREVEEELSLALDEISRMVGDGTHRATSILGDGVQRIKTEIGTFGTFDLPARKRRPTRVLRQRVRAMQTLTDHLQRVRRATAGSYSMLALELELVGLEAKIKDVLEEHVSQLENDVRGRAYVQTDRAQTALREALQKVDETLTREASGESMAMTLREVAQEAEKVVGDAARAASQLRDQLSRERTVSPLLDALGRTARTLTDRYEVSGPLGHGEWKLPPAPSLVEVPLRELVITHVDTRVAPKLLASLRQMAEKVQPLAASLSELERLVAFNIELATGELEVVQEESVPDKTRQLLRDMVAGALERSLANLDGHLDSSRQWPEQIGEELRQAVLGGIEDLRHQLAGGEITRTRVESMRRSAASRRIVREAGQLPGRMARARSEARDTLRTLFGAERLERWRGGLGLPTRARTAQQQADAFAPPQPIEDLPLVYRRLFSPDTLEAGDVLTGRDPEIARARSVLVGETPGRLRAVALVGPDGVGKTAVSGAIVRSRAWKNVRRVNLTQPATVAKIDELFQGRPEGQLMVVDGLHWMLAMHPGGFEPLRRFVDGVIADKGRNAWLVHADRLFWRYASEVAPLADAFPETVMLEPLEPGALRSAVLARHALSGYDLAFEPQHQGSWLERTVRRASRLGRPYERYFRQLHAASGGLVRDALRLWLASIERVDEENDFVYVGPVPPAPATALRQLPEDVLLNLYLIARQGWMSAEVQASLLRVDPPTAEAQLARMTHLRLLDRRQDGIYRVAVHLRGPVLQVLREKGWVS